MSNSLSWQARIVKFALHRTLRKIMRADLPPVILRQKIEQPGFLKRVFIKNQGGSGKKTLNGVNVQWAGDPASKKVLLYFHGGGYVFGSPSTHRGLADRIARTFDARTVIPDYRLAPENPFPAAVDDAFACYQGLLETGMDAEDIVIAGDSAGGGLTAALLLKIKDEKSPMPAGAMLLSPWLDLTCSGETLDTNEDYEDMLSGKMIRMAPAYYHTTTPPDHPYVSPLFGDLQGLPPILVQVGTKELLHSDSTRFVDKAEAAGVSVELQEFHLQPHVFQIFFAFVPEARTAIDRLGAFARGL